MPASLGRLKVADPSVKKYDHGRKNLHGLANSVLFCIANNMLPIYAVENKKFKALLETFDSKYKMPSCKYFSQTALPALHNKTRETVNKESEEVKEYFAATTNLWSSATSEPYINYTVHFIN